MTARFRKRQVKTGEAAIQRAVMQNFRQRSYPGVFACHVPNGGYRKPIEAAILKGQGVVSGTPDIIACRLMVAEGGSYYGQFFALELKTETGKVSETQQGVIETLRKAGAIVGVAYGLDDALRWLEDNELLRGRAA